MPPYLSCGLCRKVQEESYQSWDHGLYGTAHEISDRRMFRGYSDGI